MFVNGYPYTDFHEMNLDWIIEEFKKVHQELVDTKLYVDNGKLYIDGKLADATYQASLAEIAKTAAESARDAAANSETAAAGSATAAAGSATAAAESATQAAQTVANTLSQVSLLQSRVDNIIPSGTQTEGNTELIDIRVGENGVTYASAGDAVRGQVSDLKSAMSADGIIVNSMYQGGISSAGAGQLINAVVIDQSANRLRSCPTDNKKNITVPANRKLYITVDSGYRYACQVFSVATERALNAFEWATESESITKTEDCYLIVMLAKTDDSAISPDDASHIRVAYFEEPTIYELVNNKVDFTEEQTLTNEQKRIARRNIGVEGDSKKIILPFSGYLIDADIYKNENGYFTDFNPSQNFIKKENGVVVYMSPNGNDSNDGLTVLTPKKTLTSALSVSNVNTIILLEGIYNSGTNYSSFQDVTTELNLIGLGNVVFDNNTNDPIYFYRSVYCENIHFKGGKQAVAVKYAMQDRKATFYKCKFTDAIVDNGLKMLGGIAYVVECEANNNAFDGFNYHANTDVSPNIIPHVLEVNCKAYGNGTIHLDQSDGQSSNGSTAHDGAYIVRINGDYKCCHGGIVADKESTTACYGSEAGVSTVTDQSYPDRMSNYWCSNGQMWLYDCISYGSKYDTAVVNGGSIMSNVEYSSKYPS